MSERLQKCTGTIFINHKLQKVEKLKLKEEFKGKVIKAQIPRMGEVEFDTNRVKPEEYENYSRMGFANCFEAEKEVVVKAAKKAEEPKPEKVEEVDELDLNLEEKPEEPKPEKPKAKKGRTPKAK